MIVRAADITIFRCMCQRGHRFIDALAAMIERNAKALWAPRCAGCHSAYDAGYMVGPLCKGCHEAPL